MTPRNLGLGIAALVAVATLIWWPRRPGTPEDEIRALVAACVRAAEDKQLSTIADALAEDFAGPNGAGRQEVKQIIAYQVLRDQQTVAVFNPQLSVTVASPTEGSIDGKFVFARSKAKTYEDLPAGSEVSAYQIEAKLKRLDGKWIFTSATYRQL